MKKLLAAVLMMFVTQVFAESAANEYMGKLADRKSACANERGSGISDSCYQAVQSEDAAAKRMNREISVTQEENYRHQQEVIRDEQLRQQARRRGY